MPVQKNFSIFRACTLLFVIVLSITLAGCSTTYPFDEAYWKQTNQFYMVFNMSKRPDEADRLSDVQMFSISCRRTQMASDLIANDRLVSMTRAEVLDLLGDEAHRIGGSYDKNLQYVVEASSGGFQFYGEAGSISNYLMISFDDSDRVSEVFFFRE